MTVYCYPNPPNKKTLKQWVAEGRELSFQSQSIDFGFGESEVKENGNVPVCGPHYPKAHRWYAEVTFENGKPIKVK